MKRPVYLSNNATNKVQVRGVQIHLLLSLSYKVLVFPAIFRAKI